MSNEIKTLIRNVRRAVNTADLSSSMRDLHRALDASEIHGDEFAKLFRQAERAHQLRLDELRGVHPFLNEQAA